MKGNFISSFLLNCNSKCECLFFRFKISFERTFATPHSLVKAVYLAGTTSPTSRFLGPTTAADTILSSVFFHKIIDEA